jgi:hypothetical protein
MLKSAKSDGAKINCGIDKAAFGQSTIANRKSAIEKSMLRQKQVPPLTDELCDPVHRGEQSITVASSPNDGLDQKSFAGQKCHAWYRWGVGIEL